MSKCYAVLSGGPGDNRLVLVDRGQKEFLLPIEACNCGVIRYDQRIGQSVKTFLYQRTEHRIKGMPVFEYMSNDKLGERDDENGMVSG